MATRISNSKIERRQQILEAALKIIGEEGLRGLTYRSIAEAANIPLGSTTYYYSSIEELYLEAYELYQTNIYEYAADMSKGAGKVLLNYLKSTPRNRERFDELVHELAALITDYIRLLAVTEFEKRKIEAAFEHKAISDRTIRDMVWSRRTKFIELCTEWFQDIGLSKPAEAAEMFMGTMNQLERRALMVSSHRFNKKHTYSVMHYFFSTVLSEIIDSATPS